jgi:fatty-acyl-CoA synthase
MVWATLAVGAANVPLAKVTGEGVLEAVRRHGVTCLCAAPVVVRLILKAAAGGAPVTPGVQLVTAGGAPDPALLQAVEERLGWSITHLYGLTETSAFLTGAEPSRVWAQASPSDRARLRARQGLPLLLAGAVRVVRRDGVEVAPDGRELGEVVARGNGVMAGYHRDPEATAEALRGGWLHTGDLAVRHPDGTIEIRDRLKDVVKSGGEQIPSLEVEAVLLEHPGIAEVAVVAGPHPLWGETPVAFAVPHGTPPPAEEVLAHCRERLAHFKVPSRIVWVAALPRTASGKVRKAELRARLQAGEGDEGAAQEPTGSPVS